MDSMQIFKEMDIGTAKPTEEEQAQIPHHLVDFVAPDCHYDVSDFVADAQRAIIDIRSRHHLPMLVGGTGLYLHGLLYGLFVAPEIPAAIRADIRQQLISKGNAVLHAELAMVDPPSAQRIHKNDSQRLCRALEIFTTTGIPWSDFLAKEQQMQKKPRYLAVKIGLERPREEIYERINRRVDIMIEQGLLAEVEDLLQRYSAEEKAMQSLGYRHMVQFLQGKWDWSETLRLLARDTRHYAKRQLTWFRRDKEILWFHPDDHEAILKAIRQGLAL